MVQAESVHKSFGRLQVLKGIDLEVGTGEVVCILGPSGSGKSTFLRCTNHLARINAGRPPLHGAPPGSPERAPVGIVEAPGNRAAGAGGRGRTNAATSIATKVNPATTPITAARTDAVSLPVLSRLRCIIVG